MKNTTKWQDLKLENQQKKTITTSKTYQEWIENTQQKKDEEKEHNDRIKEIDVTGAKIVKSKTLRIIEITVTILTWASKILKFIGK